MGFLDTINSFIKPINKVNTEELEEQQEGVISDEIPELKLNKDNETLIKTKNLLEKEWKEHYDGYLKDIEEKNENYWKGDLSKETIVNVTDPIDNVIFESVETLLPIITRQNPEPTVLADNSPEGVALSKQVKTMLVYLSDILGLRIKLRSAARNWMMYRRGFIKVGWNFEENEIDMVVVRPQRIILDPEGTIDERGIYMGAYLGEKIKSTAGEMKLRFPSKSKDINELTKGNDGTKLRYIEWWTPKYMFWTMGNEVLDKIKNPHWNYETTEEQTTVDDFGNEIVEEVAVPGKNHFNVPQIPYIALSVYNLGKRPYDVTSLIEQSISHQNNIVKRSTQITRNADNVNGGLVVSSDNFSEEDAKKVSRALRNGGTVLVAGDVSRAVSWQMGTALPPFVYNNLIDSREEIRNIMGVRGSSLQGMSSETTVRGKIVAKGQDTDRASMPADFLEQVADRIFNWFLQLIYVYYTDKHVASIVGSRGMVDYVSISNEDLDRKLVVSVKEGSMIPKDSVTKRNEAVDLWSGGAIDPVSLYEALDYPDPQEMAKSLIEWQTNPQGFVGMEQAQPQLPGQPMPQGQPVPQQTPQVPEDVLSQVPIQ